MCVDLPRKLYGALPDRDGARHGMRRVIDESGEDYLYPRSWFVPLDVPAKARKVLSALRVP